jgi:hypothetical protein
VFVQWDGGQECSFSRDDDAEDVLVVVLLAERADVADEPTNSPAVAARRA